MTTIADVIKNINPDARFLVRENKEDFTVDWLEGTTPISNDDLLAKRDELQAEYDALAWKRSREENYPSIAELTVALYDTDDKADIEAKRAAVKKKYPKP